MEWWILGRADLGDGSYNCTYPDGLTDHGRMIELFADTVRFFLHKNEDSADRK